ncbi:DNA-processing protein DprA [Microbacterium capsulatum]|uniref:DNA-processing protein DprA n=1 Tax=Microbacterium capsulatum TaxID=3041921 RepID=A0ABU0XEB4_9MICO|nr:DNA-processing protein DprA [Microbacterium sp. ASV81]MDQ4213277.1 DNA-processing protein DprA [Microbacterium sp. ASV81]
MSTASDIAGAPGAAGLRRRLDALRTDRSIVEEACRIRADAGSSEVFAGLIWNLVTEPGDGVAGALVAALGVEGALDCAFGSGSATTEADPLADDPRASARALREGRKRWGERLDPGFLLISLRAAVRTGSRLLLPADPEWPEMLADLGDHAPLALWLRGDPAALNAPGVAIVGARAASSYGEHVAGELAGDLAQEGRVIVSGGAYGIDGAAHRAALRAGGITVAVLAGGIDRAYPAGHAQLFERIVAHGAVVSEVPCGGAPTRWRFLERNRVIGALAAATVVVEAGWRSGSLNTAGHAATLGRPLGAVPGPVTSAASAGCHRLLREYDARCITSAADVRELLGATTEQITPPGEDPDMLRLADALSTRAPRDSADLARRSGLSRDRVEALLGILELDGSAVRTATGWRSIAV